MNPISAQPNILLANHCSFSLTAMQINFETLDLRKNLVSMKDAQQVIVYVKIMLGQINYTSFESEDKII